MSPRRERPPGTILRTVSRRISAADAADPATVDAVRAILLDELNEFADRCGFTRSETREDLRPDMLVLTGMMSPRTDGQWPEIHQAVADARADLRALKETGDAF